MNPGRSSTTSGASRLWPNVALDVDPEQIMAALERSFPIRLIGTFDDLVTCHIEDSLNDVVSRADAQDFDYLPVTDGDKIVGLLNRGAAAEGRGLPANGSERLVNDAFDRLDEGNIIAADAGILVFLRNANTKPCRLILTGDQVTGLVNKSDLQKLPVRAVLFHVLTHLELVIADWIRRYFSEEASWLAVLSKERQEALEDRYAVLVNANMAVDRLTATFFADKCSVLLKLSEFQSRSLAEKQFERIKKLRDAVAHSGDYALTEESTDLMIENIAMAQSWINSVPDLTPKPKA